MTGRMPLERRRRAASYAERHAESLRRDRHAAQLIRAASGCDICGAPRPLTARWWAEGDPSIVCLGCHERLRLGGRER